MTTSTTPIPELAGVAEAIQRARDTSPDDWQRLITSAEWTIYTDGSAPIKNPGGPIGFSSVFLLDSGETFEVFGGVPGRTSDPATSNNRAEISGALTILEVLYLLTIDKLELPKNIEIVCDSQYVVKCATGQYKKHKNKDLWRRFDQLMCVARQNKVRVKFSWTRAHVGTKWNERADVLAKDGAFLAIGKLSPTDGDKASSGQTDNAKSEATATTATNNCDYMIRLYSEMASKSSATATYRLATRSREREATLEFENVLTLDEAEYQVLDAGLSDLIDTLEKAEKNPKEYRVLVDSSRDLMLKQIQGLYKVNSERLQPLHKRVSSKVRQFGGIEWLKSPKAELKSDLKTW